MSHRPERTDSSCLNCGAEVYGRYCHVCGQQNIEPKETFWELITHFVYDLTHFDGKFFSTLKYLLFRPGYLSLEYMRGRRMSYLHPIRMYIFTSAFFFLFFFSVVQPEKSIETNIKLHSAEDARKALTIAIAALETSLKDSSKVAVDPKKIERRRRLALYKQDLERLKLDTTNLDQLNIVKRKGFHFSTTNEYKTYHQYDSVQQSLPAKKKDNLLMRKIRHKEIEIQTKYGKDPDEAIRVWGNIFFHSFPKLLFISLPLFALLLKFLYIRRKQFYYTDHTIYSIHLYCAWFVMIFIFICLNWLDEVRYFGWVRFIEIGILIYMFWYIYKSMRKFYQQRRAKTIFKFFILMFLSTMMMILLFTGFFIFSVFSV